MEDYLETILTLEASHRVARVKDIAESLNVQMPSVTSALKNLKEHGMVNYEKNSYIMLSEKGQKVAESVIQRHFALAGFLQRVLCVPVEQSQETACRIEHVISPEIAERLKNLTSYIEDHVIGRNLNRAEWTGVITASEKSEDK